MRTVLRIVVLGFGSLCLGILINQITHQGIRWHILVSSLPRFSRSINYNYISADSAYALFIAKRGRFFDIRSSDDFLLDHIPGACSVPYMEMLKRRDLLQHENRDTAVVCYGFNPEDKQVKRAADLLKQWGFPKVTILHGGFAEWIEMGFPVETADEQ